MNAEKNLGEEDSAMKTKNARPNNVFCEDDRSSIALSTTTVLR
jgi:hypothetical protein